MNRLPIKCKPIDDLLGGGIESRIITEIHGEAGSGKTNICLQASREYASNGKKVAYIDSEGVSLERLMQLCKKKYNHESIFSNILFFNPSSLNDQEKMIKAAIKINDVGLIVIDTINLFYRISLDDNKEDTMRSFVRQIAKLQQVTREKNLFILIAEQVYTNKNGEIKPFTNRDTEHMVKTIIKLEKTGIGKRQAIIIKHRSQPEGKKVTFKIEGNGLE